MNNPFIKVAKGCIIVCMKLKISLTARQSWFSFTMKLLFGIEKVYDFFEVAPV